jgi:predicted transcriptional regulator
MLPEPQKEEQITPDQEVTAEPAATETTPVIQENETPEIITETETETETPVAEETQPKAPTPLPVVSEEVKEDKAEPIPEPPKELIKEEPPAPLQAPSHITDEQVKRDAPIAPTPPVAPHTTPSQVTDKPALRDAPIAPAKHDPKYTKDVPKRVLELTEEEIEAARMLWAREHIAEAQTKSNISRKKHMNEMMNEIEALVKANPEINTHAIANKVNLSEKSASSYIQKLVKSGRIKASGNTHNRRYFV